MTIDVPALIRGCSDSAALVSALEALSDEERAAVSKLAAKSLPAWRRSLDPAQLTPSVVEDHGGVVVEQHTPQDVADFTTRQRIASRLALAAVALGVPGAKVAALFVPETVFYLHADGGIEPFVRLATAQGPEWAEAFIPRVLRNRRVATTVHLIVPRLVAEFGLPIPESQPYLDRATQVLPALGIRWQDHFLTACITPGTFGTPSFDREKHIAGIREAAAALRPVEPLDDAALLDGLLQVIERGERPGIQREALAWIEGLDLDLATQPERLLEALSIADAHVAMAFTRVLLGLGLGDDALTQLALAILPRKEKGLRREALKRLDQLTAPTAELSELVAELRTSTDTTTAKLASTLCQSWGAAPAPEVAPRGLWQEPSLPAPEPFPVDPLVLYELELLALIQKVGHTWRPQQLEERLLAVLVATARERGPQSVVTACRNINREITGNTLVGLLKMLGEGSIVVGTEPEPPRKDSVSLSFLGLQRVRGALHRLGELSVLLSTPSTSRWEVTATDLRSRIEQYRREGVALEPADLAVALGRCDRNRADELVGLDAPIRGFHKGFAGVLKMWREETVEPPTFVIEGPTSWCDPITVQGDDPRWHEALGVARQDHSIPAHLLPEHLARPVVKVFNGIARYGPAAALERLLDCLAVARTLDEPLIVATLATAGVVPAKDRASVAAELLQAWDEGRLTPDDLATAWHSPLWEQFRSAEDYDLKIERADGKVAALLEMVAEAGGLALAWPLLVEIAEGLAGAEQMPVTASGVLETVLALLPEVPHTVELPNITALADRKGSTKAIKTARLIKEVL
ncbi:MAG: hypothetical protein Q4D96_11140 [Propionibacteriaceae bacterium]|nr:hypothetical protein [Propionibacteriaceae bacterium]